MQKLKKEITRKVFELLRSGYQILVNETPGEHKIQVGDTEIKRQPEHEMVSTAYNRWYSVALPFVRQVLPDRLDDFIEYYKNSKPRKDISYLNYNISDYLIGLQIKRGYETVVNSESAFSTKFQNQLAIIESALDRIDNLLSNITEVLQNALFDAELETATELLKKKHLRAAGAIAGVVLEKHFEKVLELHVVKTKKKVMHLSDYLEELKNNNLIDTPTWRFIQRLGDIRNYCVHSKDRDPKMEEVKELIDGADKIIKTVN